MGTTAEKLTYLNGTKTQLKDMLNLGGASLTTEPFRQYVDTLKNRYLYFINNGTQEVWDNWEKVVGEGTTITLNNTEEAPMKIDLKGNTSQEGTPTPDAPQDIHVVSGDNTITISNQDGTDSNTYNIDLPVENLFDKDNANYVNGWIDGTTMRLNTINGNRIFYIPCKPNTTYTISRSVITSSFRTTTYDSTPFPTATSSNVNYTVPTVIQNNSGTTLTITTNANAKYLVVHYGKIEDTNLNEMLATIQVEYGSKQNSYTPYGTTPIELCKIGDYQDTIVKDNGKWYLNKQIGKDVLNGSEYWWFNTSSGEPGVGFAATAISTKNSENFGDGLCNYFQNNKEGKAMNSVRFGANDKALYFYIDNTVFTTIEIWKNWVRTHNIEIYYVLATPTYDEITDTTLLSQLEALAKSYNNQTNISQNNNDSPFIINATALREMS